MDALAFPKPTKRHRDPKAIAAYRARVRKCECGCGSNRALEVHHLVSRKMGGGDVEENLAIFTAACHSEWHTLGGHEWYRRHQHRLADDIDGKIRAALRLEAE